MTEKTPALPSERLLGYRIEVDDEGDGAHLTIYSRNPGEPLHTAIYAIEPYLVDLFRAAVVRELPDRPLGRVDMADLRRRHEALSD